MPTDNVLQSEILGRQVIFTFTFAIFTIFNAACAGAHNIATLLVFRFIAGAFGSSPLTNAGGILADLFEPKERGFATTAYTMALAMGPSLGPMIGGFIGEHAGWRVVMGILALFSGVLWIVQSLMVPETYGPVLLRQRAAALTKKTGKVYRTKVDIQKGPISVKAVITTTLTRPWILLVVEPIVLLLTIYLGLVYGKGPPPVLPLQRVI